MKGKFIVLEGIDGCGKDTQQDLFLEYLKKNGEIENWVFVQVLDEKTDKGKRLRETIFNKDYKWETKAEICLFYADRFEMMVKIGEALESGKNVLCNRFELSQYAYQVSGKQREDLREFSDYMTSLVQEKYQPDLYILFDISSQESQKRKLLRTKEIGIFEDYYDNAKADFMERVILSYKTEIQKYDHVIINGEQSKEKVFEDTLQAIKKIL